MKIKATIRPADQVEEAGFAKFNNAEHLCVEIPDGITTISAKLSNGRRITFSFLPYETDGVPRCVDIHDDGGEVVEVNGREHKRQSLICFGGGTANPFVTDHRNDEHPVTLTTILLHDPEILDNDND